jgi:YVTN family beta-propeller protein
MRRKAVLPALSLLLALLVLLADVGATGPTVVATVTVGSLPEDVAVNADANRIYVTVSGQDAALSVVDGSTDQVVDEVAFGYPPWAVALNPLTGRLYVSFAGGHGHEDFIEVIDEATKQTVDTVSVGSWPMDMAVNTATDRAYVLNHADATVMVIEGATNQVVATVEVAFLPRRVAVDQTTNRVYVRSQDALSVIDGATNQVVDSIALDKSGGGLDLNSETGRIYVTNTFDNSVSVIDSASKAVVATVPVGTEPDMLAVNPTTNHIIVTNEGSDDVTIIDGTTNSVVATLSVGDGPRGVAVNPVTNRAYVANRGDGSVSVISDAPPGGTPTPTPPPGATGFTLATGWNHVCYIGAEQPIEDALAPFLADVAAVYRLRSDQGYDRWFSGRPEVSTIATVSPHKPLLLLMTAGATWNQLPPDSPAASASLVQGWNSVCYTGAAKPPDDATSGIAEDFTILYMLRSNQAWSRYVPGRPEVSNIAQLGQYDAALMLVTEPGPTTWTFDP